MVKLRTFLMLFAVLAIMPAVVYAQAAISGVVRDTSGAVLPGVTVEATSPALIEKVRSAVSDGTGQYSIESLPPGAYTVTFTLPGFAVVRREGIELAGNFTARVNADLRVGAVEETVTVTGESPVVDVQNTVRQRVIDREILDNIPSGGTAFSLGVLIPGVSFSRQDVGGAGVQAATGNLTAHGSSGSDAATTVFGVSVTELASSAATTTMRMNPIATQEIDISTAAGTAELNAGGVRTNYVPREGGNTFHGSVFGAFANGTLQSSNLTQSLKDRGLSTPASIKKNWDFNPGFGGPILQNKLWFFAAARYNVTSDYAPGLFYNRNANNPNAWTFDPDPSRPINNELRQPDTQIRLALQATQKDKVGATYYWNKRCFCPNSASATVSLEAAERTEYPLLQLIEYDWKRPATNRLLFEFAGIAWKSFSHRLPWLELDPRMIGVTEQSTGLSYRSGDPYRRLYQDVWTYSGTSSYITGAHSVKVGITHKAGKAHFHNFNYQPVSYRFNNGVPNQITQRAFPWDWKGNIDHDMGLFAQDRWTVSGLTLMYGVRYDYFSNGFPEQTVGPAELAPARNITFPALRGGAFHDLSPKFGVSYDPFGTGKTALKVTLNRYVEAQGPDTAIMKFANPTQNLVTSTTRSWNDANRDFVPNCNLVSPFANGECGGMANSAFGGEIPGATTDPELYRGWGHRGFNWEFSTGVQHELLPGMSADVSYFRRSYGNFPVTDNLVTSPTDFDPFSIRAPVDPRLPGGGGYVVSGLYNLNPAKFGMPAQNFVTLSSRYGKQTNVWQGVDIGLSARPRSGLLFQGGVSTGRRVTENCDVVAKLDNPSLLYCHVAEPLLTQVKGLGSYTIPRLDVQVSGTYQNLPGPQILANYTATNAEVAPSLGRSFSGGASNVVVNIVAPGSMYGDRLNQLDLRVSKAMPFRGSRARVNVDLYNALNSSAVLGQNNSYGAWLRPTVILTARFVKVSAQIDF
jgi:hypothetical protein